MYPSLINNSFVYICLGLILLALYFLANHFLHETKWITALVVCASLAIISWGGWFLYWAFHPEIYTMNLQYDSMIQYGEVLSSKYLFQDDTDWYELSVDYFSIGSVLPDGELLEGNYYEVSFERNTDILVSVSELN